VLWAGALVLLGHVFALVSPKPWGERGAELGQSPSRGGSLVAALPQSVTTGGESSIPCRTGLCGLLPVAAAADPALQPSAQPRSCCGSGEQSGSGRLAEGIFRRIRELVRAAVALQAVVLPLAWDSGQGHGAGTAKAPHTKILMVKMLFRV